LKAEIDQVYLHTKKKKKQFQNWDALKRYLKSLGPIKKSQWYSIKSSTGMKINGDKVTDTLGLQNWE
jgi:hypothetical protein